MTKGSILLITFKVKEDAPSGTYKFYEHDPSKDEIGLGSDVVSWDNATLTVVSHPYIMNFPDIVVSDPVNKNTLAVNINSGDYTEVNHQLASLRYNVADITINNSDLSKLKLTLNGINSRYSKVVQWKKDELTPNMS
jgi:hypothetical protein